MQINKLVPCYTPFFLLELDNKISIIPKSEDDIDANIPIVNKIWLLKVSICITTTNTMPPNTSFDMSSMYSPDFIRTNSLVFLFIQLKIKMVWFGKGNKYKGELRKEKGEIYCIKKPAVLGAGW